MNLLGMVNAPSCVNTARPCCRITSLMVSRLVCSAGKRYGSILSVRLAGRASFMFVIRVDVICSLAVRIHNGVVIVEPQL